METVKDEGEKDMHEENSWARVTKMGKWDSKLETEMGPWHNLLDRQDVRGLAQPIPASLQKNWKK